MSLTPEFTTLLRAIEEETQSSTRMTVAGRGQYSKLRTGPENYTFDCFYSGENLVPFDTGDGKQEFKVADLYLRKSRWVVYQYCLTASGVVFEIGPDQEDYTESPNQAQIVEYLIMCIGGTSCVL